MARPLRIEYECGTNESVGHDQRNRRSSSSEYALRTLSVFAADRVTQAVQENGLFAIEWEWPVLAGNVWP